MTEITRVPLQPIAKGALGKLWLGVAAAALAAGGLAWATLPKGVDVETIKAGTGPSPTVADVVQINYKGSLENGKVFDQAERAVFPVEGVIPGFTARTGGLIREKDFDARRAAFNRAAFSANAGSAGRPSSRCMRAAIT